ncbi:hypothetical protein [Pseudobutyrivibrio sp.]|jgi:hypothetical protein|uniref:hypothetical protein n=1 Tax=Pseudobutyrivibrio sp. TaxID=2014367 RepID=UPI0025D5B6F1|nr:hypothetical protein [Pseudobutyrivibrio sp.]
MTQEMMNEIAKKISSRTGMYSITKEELDDYADTYADEIQTEVSPYVAFRIAENLITLNSEYLEVQDLYDIYDAVKNGDKDPIGWLLQHEFDTSKEQREYMTRKLVKLLKTILSNDEFFIFFGEVFKATRKKLNAMGENTDV